MNRGLRIGRVFGIDGRSEEHTSELQSPCNLVCSLLLEKKTEVVVRGPYIGEAQDWRSNDASVYADANHNARTSANFFSLFNGAPTTGTSTLSLHDALPI